MEHVLISGGTGLTGNAVVRYMLEQGIEVTALVRPNSSRLNNMPRHEKLHIIFCGLDEYKMAGDKLKAGIYDAFYHFAWDGSMGKEKIDNRNNVSLQYDNIGYLLDAVELCHILSCPKFIVTGSQAEYGRVSGVIDENTETHPENAYGMAKVCSHGMAEILCKKYEIALIWVRLFSVYGPRDGAQSLVDTGIKSLLYEGKSIDYTSGEQNWNYLYSKDAAKAFYLLGEKGHGGETYCVASSQTRRLKEYIQILHDVVKPDIVPNLGKIPFESNQVMNLSVNISKLSNETGFTEEYTFAQGINEIRKELEHEL